MLYKFNPTFDELLSGELESAVLVRGGQYVAWTRTWEGPSRPDLPAAKADLADVHAYQSRTLRELFST